MIGKNFFRDVAPGTAVREFEGKFQTFRATGKNGRPKLLFVFKFSRGTQLVEIAMACDAATDISTLLGKVASQNRPAWPTDLSAPRSTFRSPQGFVAHASHESNSQANRPRMR